MSCYDTPESDLWISVLRQALYDATLGLGVTIKGKRRLKHVGHDLSPLDVAQARSFIAGKTGSLKDICDALGMDFETTKGDFLKIYAECLPLMPEEWRQDL